MICIPVQLRSQSRALRAVVGADPRRASRAAVDMNDGSVARGAATPRCQGSCRKLADAWIAARLEEADRFARENARPRKKDEPAHE